MPRYPKPQPNIPFNGITSTRYDNEYVFKKVVFTILGNCDLWIRFIANRRLKLSPIDFYVDNFIEYTAVEVIRHINTFNATPSTKTKGPWGRHFEDGILEIWKAFELPFGWVTSSLGPWKGKVL